MQKETNSLITAAGALDFFCSTFIIAFHAGNLLAGILRGGVDFHQLQNVELGLLQDLHLADEAVLERVDSLACLLDVTANAFWDKFGNEFLQVALGVLNNDFAHLLTDSTDLCGLCVTGLLGLVLPLHGESNAEDAEGVAIRGADVNISFDKRLPLLDEGAQLITGHFHAVEVGNAVVTLYIVTTKLDLTESLVFVIVKVSKGHFENATLKGIRGNLCS